MDLKQYYNKKVIILGTSGGHFSGRVSEYFFPEDNENEQESIVVETDAGELYEFYEGDISSITVQ